MDFVVAGGIVFHRHMYFVLFLWTNEPNYRLNFDSQSEQVLMFSNNFVFLGGLSKYRGNRPRQSANKYGTLFSSA